MKHCRLCVQFVWMQCHQPTAMPTFSSHSLLEYEKFPCYSKLNTSADIMGGKLKTYFCNTDAAAEKWIERATRVKQKT